MRYPAEQKAETHKRIIQAASRSFREHGSDGQGIARLMKDLGLTHGGFYKHFDSKDQLYVESIRRAFQEAGDRMVSAAKAAPKGRELRAIIEHYLSREHMEHPGAGCVVATLAPEIARQPAATRREIQEILRVYRDRIASFLPGHGVEEKRRKFMILFPSMAGVLMMARVIADPASQGEVLSAAREFYIKNFAGPAVDSDRRRSS